MAKHTLFMLTPWMEEGAGPFYCPDCGVVEGFLHYSPKVRQEIEIVHVNFRRPRNQIVELLGQENQNSPVLVLAKGPEIPAGAKQSMSTGKWFIDDGLMIATYLAEQFGGVLPHP